MDYCLGIDGGGSKTVCVLSTTEGEIVGRGLAGPANYHVVGEAEASEALRTSIEQAVATSGRTIPELRCLALGIAGVDRPADRVVMGRILDAIGMQARARIIENDAAIALVGASLFDPGVLLIGGTGSIAFGCNRQGERKRAGGWGPILGDEGSGYDIGRQAMIAVMRAADSRGPQTGLTAGLLGHLGLSSAPSLVDRVHAQQMQRHEIAALAPLVITTADDGDQVAESILQTAGRELAAAAAAVIVGLGMEADEFPLSLSGGVLQASPLLARVVGEQVRLTAPRARLTKPRFEPAIGALLLALRQANGCLSAGVLERITATVQRG